MPTKQTRINRFLILAPTLAALFYGRFAPPLSIIGMLFAGAVISTLIIIAEKYIKK